MTLHINLSSVVAVRVYEAFTNAAKDQIIWSGPYGPYWGTLLFRKWKRNGGML
jgi:hypothetical protein